MNLIINDREQLEQLDSACLSEIKKDTPLVVGVQFTKILTDGKRFGLLVPSNSRMKDILIKVAGKEAVNSALFVNDEDVVLWT